MADVPGPRLSLYLASIRLQHWRPGTFDCAVFMADWVRELTGHDPMADIRGTYSSEKQFLRIARGEGGFEKAVARRLAAVGYEVTSKPAAGDLAVVMAPYAVRRGEVQYRPAGAIAVDDTMRAVVTSDLGLVIARLPTIEVYRWPR